MSPAFAVPLFLASLAVTLAAAGLFARSLDGIGVSVGFPEPLLGLLTALAADGPEITSALVALVKGAKGVGLGVLVGSNVFNLAAMIGLSAVLVGSVHLRRGALVLEGSVGLIVTLTAAALVLGALPPPVATLVFAATVVPYVVLLVRGPLVALRLPLSEQVDRELAWALVERERHGRRQRPEEGAILKLALVAVPALVLIVIGSWGMVQAALGLSNHWNVPRDLIGVLVLAPLTSLPNAFTAVRLGIAGRGSALVSETFNSNTINLAVGVILPALVVSMVSVTGGVKFDLTWLLFMTVASLLLLSPRRGMGRGGGGVLIGLYLIFVTVVLARA